MSSSHKPTITTVQTFDSPEWIATCPACQWHDHRAIRRQLIVDAANAHEREHLPADRRPAPTPPDPPHGIQRVRAAGGEIRLDCYCGKGWTGAPSPVRTTMAEHLSAHGATVPDPWPQPEPPPAPRRLRSSPPSTAATSRTAPGADLSR